MNKLLFIALISFTGLNLKAQPNIDSLWSVWNDNTQADTIRLEAIKIIASDGYLYSQPDSAFYFAQLGYKLAKKSGLKNQMASALITQGVSFYIRGDNPKALDYFQKCLKVYEEIDDKEGIANTLGNMGVIYYGNGNYPKALDYFQKSLKIKEKIEGYEDGTANILNNLGSIYKEQGDYSKALEHHQKSLKISQEIGYKAGIANSLGNIGITYLYQSDYPKALDYFQKCLKLHQEVGNKIGILNSLGNIGITYKDLGDYPKALDYFQRSLKITEELSSKKESANTLNNIGGLYQEQGDYLQAINQCSKSLLLAQEIGSIDLQRDACQCLYEAYKAKGNGNKALYYHEQMLVLNDSLNAQETQKKLQQMEFQKAMLQDSIAKAEEARLVQEAHEAEMRQGAKTRNWALAGGVLALLLAGGFFSRWRYVQNAKAIIESERDRSDNLLLNILPEEIAQELKEKGKAEARDFEMASILFTDFKGFTEQSAKLSAAELVNEINHCFEVFDGIIEKYDIEKIKTIGDAYMAAGGLPVQSGDSIKNTVLAALEMQDFITKRKAQNDATNKSAFEMRVGIHTGPVVAGIVGVKKFQYDIWGDTVNTASRMESSGEVGKVNISQSTYELLADDAQFKFESRGKIKAKGKGEMEMYFVSKN